MQDNINSIILSFINKAQEEQQQQQQNNQNNNNSENDQNQQNQQNSSSSSPKNTTGLSQGSNSPAQNQSPKLEPPNLSEQPISGISLQKVLKIDIVCHNQFSGLFFFHNFFCYLLTRVSIT